MFSPLLDAFKSLSEVSDEIVAKEKRIIKESLEESDYKVDEDALDVEFSPIENTFTASNIYEGLDDIDEVEEIKSEEELEEEILDEKLPKDLAKAYRKTDKYRTGFTGSNYSADKLGVKVPKTLTSTVTTLKYDYYNKLIDKLSEK